MTPSPFKMVQSVLWIMLPMVVSGMSRATRKSRIMKAIGDHGIVLPRKVSFFLIDGDIEILWGTRVAYTLTTTS